MLLPDVTEILDDPELGGSQPFTVVRTTNTRTLGKVSISTENIPLTGNIQPQDFGSQSSTVEDTMNETIVIYAKFGFQCGENDGSNIFYGADEILYNGMRYRVTRVNNWIQWGFSIAYATKVMDVEVV